MKASIFRKVSCWTSAALLTLFMSCGSKDVTPTQPTTLTAFSTNPDVEAGTTLPTSWYPYPGTSGSYLLQWSKEESSSPTSSLKISCQNADPSDISYWVQTITGQLPFGKDITLTVKIKGKNLSGTGVAVALRADNSASTSTSQFFTTQGNVSILGNIDWTTYTVKLPVLRNDAKNVLIFLMLLPGSTGTVYFDDISVSHN